MLRNQNDIGYIDSGDVIIHSMKQDDLSLSGSQITETASKTIRKRYLFEYDFIRTLLTWTIVLTHVLTTAEENDITRPPVLRFVFEHASGGLGQIAVSVFFLLSGVVIHKNHKKKENVWTFYRGRMIKLLLPIVICSLPLIAIDYLLRPEWFVQSIEYIRNTVWFNFLGLDLYLLVFVKIYPYHVAGEWFTSVILTMYALYPLLKKWNAGIRKQAFVTVAVLLLYLANVKYPVFTGGDGMFSFTRGLLFFWCGMLYEEYEEFFKDKRIWIAASLGFLVLYAMYPIRLFRSTKLTNTALSFCVFVALAGIGRKCRFLQDNPLAKRVIEGSCRNSYMIYLSHHFIVVNMMIRTLDPETGTLHFYLVVLMTSFLIYLYSELMNRIAKKTIRMINVLHGRLLHHKETNREA